MVVEVGGVDEQVQNTKTAATIKVIAVPIIKAWAFCIGRTAELNLEWLWLECGNHDGKPSPALV
jgi:hypothetical protein